MRAGAAWAHTVVEQLRDVGRGASRLRVTAPRAGSSRSRSSKTGLPRARFPQGQCPTGQESSKAGPGSPQSRIPQDKQPRTRTGSLPPKTGDPNSGIRPHSQCTGTFGSSLFPLVLLCWLGNSYCSATRWV